MTFKVNKKTRLLSLVIAKRRDLSKVIIHRRRPIKDFPNILIFGNYVFYRFEVIFYALNVYCPNLYRICKYLSERYLKTNKTGQKK
jgi:hypothetical protein